MKIQCDVCNKDEASVFCTADEAALCDGCDHRVHHANKLASKHQRFCLHRPSSSAKQYPLCDVCLERRAFVFCQQDRAILCKDCDLPIHSANEHTRKHNRFLLTGIKLSATATLYSPSSSASNSVLTNASGGSIFKSKTQSSVKNSVLASSSSSSSSSPSSSNVSNLYQHLMAKISPSMASTTPPTINKAGGSLLTTEGAGSISTSNISEYLIETLPGWQVEDFLDSSFAPFGFCKSDDMLPPLDAGIEGNLGSLSSESMGIWVPQAPCSMYSSQMDRQKQTGHRETKEATSIKASKSMLNDDNFIVPQVSPASERSRFLR